MNWSFQNQQTPTSRWINYEAGMRLNTSLCSALPYTTPRLRTATSSAFSSRVKTKQSLKQSDNHYSVKMGIRTTVDRSRVDSTDRSKKRPPSGFLGSACLCPHCALIIREPVVLPCGHSICARCCKDLLQPHDPFPDHSLHRGGPLRIRMGVKSLGQFSPLAEEFGSRRNSDVLPTRPPKRLWRPDCRQKSLLSVCEDGFGETTWKMKLTPSAKFAFGGLRRCITRVDETEDGFAPAVEYKSPKCPVCETPASNIPPVPNLLLSSLLELLQQQQQRTTQSRNAITQTPMPGKVVAPASSSQIQVKHRVPKQQIYLAGSCDERSPTPSCGSSGSSGFCDGGDQQKRRAVAASEAESCARLGPYSASVKGIHNVSSASTKYSAASMASLDSDRKYSCSSVNYMSSPSKGSQMEEPMDGNFLKVVRVAILGTKGVGKTQLMATQALNNLFFGEIPEFDNSSPPGAGKELRAKFRLLLLDDDNLKESIFKADALVLAYSLSDPSSFNAISRLVQEIRLRRSDDPPMIVIGTKSDLRIGGSGSRKVPSLLIPASQGRMLAEALQCPFIEVSSKLNYNVNEAFCHLMQRVEKEEEVRLSQTVVRF